MVDKINAVTKYKLSDDTIEKMYRRAFSDSGELKIKALSGGFCSSVYLIESGKNKVVLKVGTKSSVKVMWHETAYITTEAQMLELIGKNTDIRMPSLLYYDDSTEICDVPYFFMSLIDGKPLNDTEGLTAEQYGNIKYEVGRLTRQITDIPAQRFGIPNIADSLCGRNSDFVILLFEKLLDDLERKGGKLKGISHGELMKLIGKFRIQLDTVEKPCLIHTDTWNGNVMVKDGEFSEMIDFAAILYGDPLMSHDFHDFGEMNADFLRGYGKTEFSTDELIRIQIYKVWQRLGMIVEKVYREYEDENLYSWVDGEFEKEVEILKQM